MKIHFLKYIIGCTALLLLSFNKDKGTFNTSDFIEWYKLNADSTQFTQKWDDITYTLKFMPKELKLMRQLHFEEIKTKKELNSWYKQNDEMLEFNLKIEGNSKNLLTDYSSDETAYQDKLFYFIESAQADLKLVIEGDTLIPFHYQFENHYGNAPFVTLYFAFKVSKNQKIKELIFNDYAFSGIEIPFVINRLNNLNIPKIK
jgi:hypothetical protein